MYEVLIGKDIILRKATNKDLDSIYKNVWSDKELFEYMNYSPTISIEEAKIRLEKSIEFQKHNYAYFICLKENDSAIGFCGIKKINDIQIEETGICIAKKYQKKGYGKQVLKLLLNLSFVNLKAKEFLYFVNENNIASQKLCLSFAFNRDLNYKNDNKILLYVLNKSDYINKNKVKKVKFNNLTGEDIELLKEKKKIKNINVCDNHWDGA